MSLKIRKSAVVAQMEANRGVAGVAKKAQWTGVTEWSGGDMQRRARPDNFKKEPKSQIGNRKRR